jgi:hypothetical protein
VSKEETKKKIDSQIKHTQDEREERETFSVGSGSNGQIFKSNLRDASV